MHCYKLNDKFILRRKLKYEEELELDSSLVGGPGSEIGTQSETNKIGSESNLDLDWNCYLETGSAPDSVWFLPRTVPFATLVTSFNYKFASGF